MLSDEEKQAIDIIKNEMKAFETVITAMEKEIDDKDWLRKNILEIKEDILVRKTLLNLIEKQSKEIEELKEERKSYAEEYIHNNPWLYKQLNENYILRVESEQRERKAYIKGTNDAHELCNKKWEDKIKAILEEYKYTEIGDSEKIIEFYKKMQSLLEKE